MADIEQKIADKAPKSINPVFDKLNNEAHNLFAEAVDLESLEIYGGYRKAREKYNKIISTYPTSAEAKEAKVRVKTVSKKLEDIDKKINDKIQKSINSVYKRSEGAELRGMVSSTTLFRGFSVYNLRFMQKDSLRYAAGSLREDNGNEYSYVSVTFELTDIYGNTLDSASKSIGFLGANKTWNFKVFLMDDDVFNAKLVDIIYSKR